MMKKRFNAEEFFCEMSSYFLRAEVLMWVERELVSQMSSFQGKSPQFISDCVSMLKPLLSHKDETVVKEGSEADEMFFRTKGIAGIYCDNRLYSTLKEDLYFGEIRCLVGGVCRASMKALTTCELHSLSRNNFIYTDNRESTS